jgi:DNA-binding transcriptional ArsR family regulator
MSRKSLVIDLDDPRTGKIADVISNKTSKKVLAFLVEKEMSGSELARGLKIPLNTVVYNIKKLEGAGLIEKAKGVLWSEKGKRVYRYRVSNRRIVISPKSMIRGVIPSVLISAFLAVGLKLLGVGSSSGSEVAVERTLDSRPIAEEALRSAGSSSVDGTVAVVAPAAESIGKVDMGGISSVTSGDVWLWFLFGALVSLLILVFFNWRDGR